VTLLWAGAALGAPPSGAFGTVIRGPITPVCSAGKPCSEPAAGAVLTFVRAGHPAVRATVGPTGSYRIRLAPGRYAVRTRSMRIAPAVLRIRPASMAHVDFSIDTGIR